jgi:hypothetical protein
VPFRDGRAQRIEHLLQRVGRVRVIDDDERLRSAAERLSATFRSAGIFSGKCISFTATMAR